MKHLTRLLITICLVALLAVLLILPSSAKNLDEIPGVVHDYANVLTAQQEDSLTAMANEYHERIGDNHILIITSTDHDTNVEAEVRKLGFTSRSDSCFALLILIPTTANREYEYMYETYTLGDMSRFISDSTYYSIDEDRTMYSMIKSGDLENAGERFIGLAGEASLVIPGARAGRIWIILAVSVVIGMIAGGLTMFLVWKKYNKKLRSTPYPFEDFTRLSLTVQRDAFIDKSVVTVRISSSSGGRGGRSGGFNRGGGGGRSGGRH